MTPSPHPAWPVPPGTVLDGRYTLTGILGRGGTGTVYQAVDRVGSAEVAIKIGTGQGPQAERIRRLIRREADCLGRVSHPRIVGLRGLTRFGDDEALVLDRLHGRTLAAILSGRRGERLSEGAALRILHDVGDALACLHRTGFVHGDVKPGNVIVAPDGHATLIDYGTARRFDETADTAFTAPDSTDLTPGYAAPDWLAGGPPDRRDDVFSLALLALVTMTGRPLPAGGVASAAVRRRSSPPAGIDPACWMALRRGLAPGRASRPHDAAAFAARLGRPSPLDRLAAWGEARFRALGQPASPLPVLS